MWGPPKLYLKESGHAGARPSLCFLDMPSYEYRCRACNTPYEVRLSMSAYAAGEGATCPSCGSHDVERRFDTVGGVLTESRSGGSNSGSSCGGGSGFT